MECSPLVSVIVPIYNVEPYIERCASSLLNQTIENIEFIFINDATTDNSMKVLDMVIAKYPERHVRIIQNEQNLGLAATRFRGIDIANGKYIYNCDSDDWVEPEMLQKMAELAELEDADIVCCEAIKDTANGSLHLKYDYDLETNANGLLALNVNEIHVAVWNKLIRRKLIQENNIRYITGVNMGEDSAITVKLRYFSKKTVIIHEAFYHYNRLNNGSMVANISQKDISQKIKLAESLENFFTLKNEAAKFKVLINWYKFEAKQYYIRNQKDFRKWRETFPESNADIIYFRNLTLLGRFKWFALSIITQFLW